MATGTAAPNYHGVLTAAAVDTITLSSAELSTINVISVDGTSRIDFTIDGSTPVLGGSPTGRVLPAAVGHSDQVPLPSWSNAVVVVKLISAGTPHYSIIAGDAGQ